MYLWFSLTKTDNMGEGSSSEGKLVSGRRNLSNLERSYEYLFLVKVRKAYSTLKPLAWCRNECCTLWHRLLKSEKDALTLLRFTSNKATVLAGEETSHLAPLQPCSHVRTHTVQRQESSHSHAVHLLVTTLRAGREQLSFRVEVGG